MEPSIRPSKTSRTLAAQGPCERVSPNQSNQQQSEKKTLGRNWGQIAIGSGQLTCALGSAVRIWSRMGIWSPVASLTGGHLAMLSPVHPVEFF